eukprot:891916-Rhodomonas_salina.2
MQPRPTTTRVSTARCQAGGGVRTRGEEEEEEEEEDKEEEEEEGVPQHSDGATRAEAPRKANAMCRSFVSQHTASEESTLA